MHLPAERSDIGANRGEQAAQVCARLTAGAAGTLRACAGLHMSSAPRTATGRGLGEGVT